MRYEEIRCRVCGSERLEKQNDGTYVCKHCRSRFRENDLEEYKKTIRSELRGVVTEALVCQRAQDVANIRRNLFEALQEEYTDSYKIIGYCRDLKRLLPNDFQANCFETLNNGRKKEVNAMLGSVDEKGAGRFYVKDILEFMVKSLTPANLLPLKSLAERALNDKEKTEYLNKVEEEAGKCEAGLYSAEVPRKAFIAYSSKDMAIVTPLVEYLENAGISCFVALRNMRHGRKAVENYDKILQRAMHNCKSFVLVSTRNSRRFDCDAIEKELLYVRDNEPNVKRIEYLVEDYGESEGAIKSTLKDFFGESGWVRNLEDLPSRIMDIKQQTVAAPAIKYCLSCGAGNVLAAIFCNQCGKREFGTKEEYEEQQQELARREAERREAERKEVERKETEQKEAACKEAARKEAERKEDERKEAECREASQKKVEKRIEATAASKAEAKAIPAASSDPADFEIEDGVLIEYRGNGGDVIIPNGVTCIGSLVFSIFQGSEPFRDCSSLTSITIPKGVTWIGDCAFCDCSGLTSITIPNSVTRIGVAAFFGCSSLTSITIPNSVTHIGDGAFSGCSSLTSITIPSSVTSIGDRAVEATHKIKGNAFEGCESLEEIKVENGNSVYHSDGNCMIETESKTLVAGCKNSRIPTDGSVTSIGYRAFKDCSGLTSITIPNSVTHIGDWAFSGCSSLTSITIPSSVTSIEGSAFEGCSSLKSITIPSSVTSIEGSAFEGCSSLKSITIPSSVTSIEGSAFEGCSSLTSITIPSSVTSIEGSAFEGCSSLKSITIPKSVTSIGDSAFSGCSGLTSIIIPNSVTSIGVCAFIDCNSLEEIKAEKGNSVYHSEGNCLIETENEILVAGCKNSRIPIDGSVTSIGEGAFYGCRGLTRITIPKSVTTIEEGAFYGCSGLTRITIPKSVTSIEGSAFGDCENLEEIKAEKGNSVYHSEGNCLIETENEILVAGCKNSRIPIDGSVTSIGVCAFYGCSGLTSITIPKSVTSIGVCAFYGCSGLTSITIPKSVTSIGRHAFSRCSGLTSITIPNSVTSIGEDAFDNCREDLKIFCHDREPLKWPKGWDVSLKDRIIWDE